MAMRSMALALVAAAAQLPVAAAQSASQCHDVEVHAGQHCSDGTPTALGAAHDFGIHVEEGAQLDISSPTTEQWTGDNAQTWWNGEGRAEWLHGQFPFFSLVGSVGNGAIFKAGTSYQGVADASGNLHFAHWDLAGSCPDDSGTLHVHVCVTQPTTTTTTTTSTTTTTAEQPPCVIGSEVQVKCHDERHYHAALVQSCGATTIVVAYALAGHTYYCTPKQWRVQDPSYVNDCAAYGGVLGKNGRCCAAMCGDCGGYFCHLRPGGGGNCCTSQIPEANVCGAGGRQAPCALAQTPETRRLGALRGLPDLFE